MTQLSALSEQHRVADQRLEAAVGKYQAVEGLDVLEEAEAKARMATAYKAEELARVPLFLYPPANEWESKMKALYIKDSTPFKTAGAWRAHVRHPCVGVVRASSVQPVWARSLWSSAPQ